MGKRINGVTVAYFEELEQRGMGACSIELRYGRMALLLGFAMGWGIEVKEISGTGEKMTPDPITGDSVPHPEGEILRALIETRALAPGYHGDMNFIFTPDGLGFHLKKEQDT
jgi:hypothetical protein